MKPNKLAIRVSGFAYLALSLSISLRLVLGNRILDNFYSYTLEGGSPLLKIHPGTWLLLISVGLFGFARGYGRLLFDLSNNLKPIGIALLATVVLMAYTVVLWGTSGAAYLVDTYLFSILCIVLAAHLNQEQCLKLFKLIAIVIIINCLVAIFEYLTKTHVVPNPVTGTGFFRANAFMAHPLNNALVALPVALAVFISPLKKMWRYAMIALVFLGIVAFATRASLVMYCAAIFFIIWSYSFTARAGKRTRALYIISAPIVIILLSLAFYFAIFFTDFGTGISSRTSVDESALARTDAIGFFTSLNVGGYFFGAGPSGFTDLIYEHSTTSIIENFWIQLLVIYGIPMFLILMYGYSSLVRWIASNSSLQFKILILAFFVAASTNNSLSTKTSALAVFILAIYLLRRLETRKTT
ncbi:MULTISPECIES: VpsF family polysaccharide biosynthesis protein [Pseudomonas]|uniref:VpsF family polysaccharide biosynthesis protein n=1 Tax=Pseudomonas TaxID=286 RepID=UPI000ACABC5E|nr:MULTISPECIES: VpsF family polysaccharide biosynthesis protein [Pseudomonas]